MATRKSKTQGVNPTVLDKFDGREVIMCSVAIPNASGGLHDALALDPVLLHTGDEIDIVLRCTVGPISFDPILDKGEDTGYYNRVAKLHANRGLIIDGKVVDAEFVKQRAKLDAARGVQAIPGIED